MDRPEYEMHGRPATYEEVILAAPTAAFIQVCMNFARGEPWRHFDGDPRFAIRAYIWLHTPRESAKADPSRSSLPLWVAVVPRAQELIELIDNALADDLERAALPPDAVVQMAMQILTSVNFPVAMLKAPDDGTAR